MDRAHERILGTILVVLGVAILLFAFLQAFALLGHLPSSTSQSGPEAAFAYTVSGLTVTVTDHSQAGSSAISSTYWAFADGNSSATANTSHTYGKAGAYNVTLLVEDKSGNIAESAAVVHVGPGATGAGVGSPSVTPGGSIGSILGGVFGTSLSGIAHTSEEVVVLVLIWLVGGSFLKAGWNLITPKAETIQVRVKPKDLAIEGVGYSAMPQPGPAASRPTAAAAGGPSLAAAPLES